jgi:cytochrome P450
VARLRPVWTGVLERRLAPLALGAELDLVPIVAELAGATAAAVLGVRVEPLELAEAALRASAAAARAHLPGPMRRRAARDARAATARLRSLVASDGDGGLGTMLAVAAISTTVAALPRAAGWAADAGLWGHADGHLAALADEMLRVTAPTPLLPRVVAAGGDLFDGAPASSRVRPRIPRLGGANVGAPTDTFPRSSTRRCPVHPGDRLLLIARHAVDAHHTGPDPLNPAPPHISQLVFGAGPHACPGARLARRQMSDLLAALAPYRPVVVQAGPDRHSALPAWRSLVIRAGNQERR